MALGILSAQNGEGPLWVDSERARQLEVQRLMVWLSTERRYATRPVAKTLSADLSQSTENPRSHGCDIVDPDR
jgi:hypothetical protein